MGKSRDIRHPKTLTIIGFVLIYTFISSGCGDVQGLVEGNSTSQSVNEAFSNVDLATRNKFARIDGLNPTEPIYLRVDLFKFLSTDTQSLTNITQEKFNPEINEAEQLAGNVIRFNNGFSTVLKFINSLACGKFSLAGLVVLLCPDRSNLPTLSSITMLKSESDSLNVAYTTDQSLGFYIGANASSLYDLSDLARFSLDGFNDLEVEIKIALSNELESSETSTEDASGEETISQAQEGSTTGNTNSTGSTQVGASPNGSNSTNTNSSGTTPLYGNQPVSHSSSKVSILGLVGDVSSSVAFGDDILVIAYRDAITRKVNVYDKSIKNGLNLLAGITLNIEIQSVDDISFGLNDRKIYISGRISSAETSDYYIAELDYQKSPPSLTSGGMTTIPNSDLPSTVNLFHSRSIIHALDETSPSIVPVRFITTGRNSGGDRVSALFESGMIGDPFTRESWDSVPFGLDKFVPIDVMYKDGKPKYYFSEYYLPSNPTKTQHAMWFYDLVDAVDEDPDHNNYGGGGIRIDYADQIEATLGTGSYPQVISTYYFDTDSIIVNYAHADTSNGTNRYGMLRLDGKGENVNTAWSYSIILETNDKIQDMAFDINEHGDLVTTHYNPVSGVLKFVASDLNY
jgi:hypothetical protein